jgi:7-carboxy-7-deazaguanine synthase
MNNKAGIIEIFSSVQGEGPCIGERHIFIRFNGCNLDCSFCDTGSSQEHRMLSIKDIIADIENLNYDNTHNTVSLTGGEPLLYSKFLQGLLPHITNRGFKIYLETNATLTENLNGVINYIDIISADIKLPSVSGVKACWNRHRDFLAVAFEKEFFVKVVVSDKTDISEFNKAISIVRDLNFDIPFIIQPETKKKSCDIAISPDRLLALQQKALKSLNNVLIIPQAHKMMGLR